MTKGGDRLKLVDQFEEDGFVLIEGFVAGAALDALITRVDRFIAKVVPCMPPEQVFYENKQEPSTLKQIQQMSVYDQWFHGLFTDGPFRDVAESLLGGPVTAKNMQYFNKPPVIGKPTPPHQDGYYFMIDPCDAVTMWLALDAADEENGCVRYVRGSHRRGMREHARTSTLGFSQGIVDYPSPYDQDHEVAVTAKPGDLLVHHAMSIHRADGNRSSTRPRRALGLIYYGHTAREDIDAHQAYQRRLATEMKNEGKI